jgi:hypothetical protein
MISSDAELQQAVEQMQRLYQVLAGLRRKVEPDRPELFAVIAEGPMDLVRQLQEQVDAYVGLAALREREADVWLRIHGPQIVWDDAPTSVVTAFVDSLRKGVQMVAEFLDTGTLTTRPTNELKHACDLRLLALAKGSVQVGLRLPEGLAAGSKRGVAEEALARYLRVAAWAAGDDDQAIDARVTDPERRVLLNAVKPLVPRQRGVVEFVELHGRRVGGRAVRLTRQSRRRLDDALDRLVMEQIETRGGVLREIDLDERTFLLRQGDDPAQIRCSFPDELYEAAKEAFDRPVRVSGVMRPPAGRRGAPLLYVQRIEVLDEVPGEEDAGQDDGGQPADL